MEDCKVTQDGLRQSIPPKSMMRGLGLDYPPREIKNCLYAFYKQEVEKRKNKMIFTDQLKNIVSDIGDFLTIEDRKYGLFLPGYVGNGKTTMMKAIRDVISYLTEKGIISYYECSKYPYFVTANQMVNILISDLTEFRKMKGSKFLFIDELGSEQTKVSTYGMVYRPFYDVLSYRYENMLPTFIASNLSPSDIREKYEDERIIDRMKEMFKIISFKIDSYR